MKARYPRWFGAGRSARTALLETTALAAISIGALALSWPAHAQSFTWQTGGGVATDYNDAGNWSPGGGPPDSPGQSAIFGPAGSTTVNTAVDINPDFWRFTANSQNYTFGGVGGVDFGLADALGGGIRNLANNSQTIIINNSLSGIGGIRQDGNSTLVLNGDNFFLTGNTTLLSGTISAGHDDALGAGTFTVLGAGTLNIQNGIVIANDTDLRANLTVNVGPGLFAAHTGDISETGGSFGITKTGTGMLVLDGSNSYTGPTNIASGVLLAASSDALPLNTAVTINAGATLAVDDFVFATVGSLSGSGNILIGNAVGAALFIRGAPTATTFSGIITGPGDLQLDDIGSQTLTGVGSSIEGSLSICGCATGVLEIRGGTLVVGTATMVQSGTLLISAGGVLTSVGNFGAPVQVASFGPVPAAAIVTGANSVWNVNPTLQIGVAFFGATGTLTIADGGVVNANNGTVIAPNSTLSIGSGGLAGVINTPQIGNDGQIVANFTDTATLSAPIDGVGSLTKLGSGTLILSGNSTYTGATTVNGGGLVVNGRIDTSSGLTVNGGFVGGVGFLPNTTINGGSLAPGNSIGTITVQGNLTFTAGATYAVELGASAAERDLTVVTNTATLAGTVAPIRFSGSLVPGTAYTILTAGALTGTFATVDESGLPPAFNASLSYTATDVLLTLSAGLRDVPGINVNQRAVGTVIDNFVNAATNLDPAFITLLNLPVGSLLPALSQLTGEVGTGMQQAGFNSLNLFLGSMLNPFLHGRGENAGGPALAFAQDQAQARSPLPRDAAAAYAAAMPVKAPPTASFERRWSLWGTAFGGTSKSDGDPVVVGSQNVRSDAYGFAAGADYRLSRDGLVGFALAGGGTNWSLSNGMGTGESQMFQAGVYGSHRFGAAYISAAAAYTWHDASTKRSITLAGIGQLNADYTANSFGGRIEGGYRWLTPVVGITPYGALQVLSIRTPSYGEVGLLGAAPFALNYSARTTTATRSEIGLWFDRSFVTSPDAALTLRARAAWAHDFNDDRQINAAFQTLPLSGFTVFGASPATDYALLSGAAEMRLRNGWSFALKGDGEFASRTQTYSGTGVVRYAW